jgi:hypothetical protein
MQDNQQRDQNVLSFMMQLVQQKYGDEVESSFLVEESNKLYDRFGEALVDYFDPLMNEEQHNEFNRLSTEEGSNSKVLEFLMREVPDLDTNIKKVLYMFKENYLNQ